MADKTVTVGPGKTYASLNEALQTEAANLTSASYYLGGPGRLIVECYNMEDTTAADTGTGYTTSSSYYILIKGADSDKTSSNTGKWSTSRYRLVVSNDYPLYVRENYTRIYDLQAQLTFSGASASTATYRLDAMGCRIERCIARGVVSGSNGANLASGFNSGLIGGINYFINCLAYDYVNGTENHRGFILPTSSQTSYWYNCTAVDCRNGFLHTAGTAYATNCGASGCDTAFGGTITQTTCSSSTPIFQDAGGDDFHLAGSDTTWHEQGTDLSGTFTDDIDEDVRTTWDIGCDEGTGLVTPYVKVTVRS